MDDAPSPRANPRVCPHPQARLHPQAFYRPQPITRPVPLQGLGTMCPHCRCGHVQRWGRSSGRQRFRCQACERTFSTRTGTALHYLKYPNRWRAFCQAMAMSLTVRQAAAYAGVHPSTAFRWRHRFLAAMRRGDRMSLRGGATVGAARFEYSVKGTRDPKQLEAAFRARARRDASFSDRWAASVPVAFARDEYGSVSAVVGRLGGVLNSRFLTWALLGRTTRSLVLHVHTGRYSPETGCARQLGINYRNVPRPAPSGSEPRPIHSYVVRLRNWLRRFRGVATRYLPHYLAWFAALETHWSRSAWDLKLAGMAWDRPPA